MFTRTIDDNETEIPVLDNAFIIGREGGDKPIHAWIVVSPGHVIASKLPESGLSDRERRILATFKQLKSSYRKRELEDAKVTELEILALVEGGYLKRNKRGATSITTKGKNNSARHYLA